MILSTLPNASALGRASLRQLGTWAKKLGVEDWRSMTKAELIQEVMKKAKSQTPKSSRKTSTKASGGRSDRNGTTRVSRAARNRTALIKAKGPRSATKVAVKKRTAQTPRRPGAGRNRSVAAEAKPKRSSAATLPQAPGVTHSKKSTRGDAQGARKLQELLAARERQMDLSVASRGKAESGDTAQSRDRVALLVRDAYWLQASWDITRASVERARAAMAEAWHTAKPILRLYEVESGITTSAAERVERDIEIHGGVRNWYIDVKNPPRRFRVEIGYLSSTGRFFSLARSNTVTTPVPGVAQSIDSHWSGEAEDFERIYVLSGGYADEHLSGELQHMFEDRLQRPVGSANTSRYGLGTDRLLTKTPDFTFQIDMEAVIYGRTKPNAHVTISGEPIRLRDDGTFVVRLNMPDRRQVLPLVASSPDGSEQRTIVLAIERNTKAMEPVVHETTD